MGKKIKVKILKPVPRFTSIDLKDYGPFAKGKVVALQEKIANLFVDRKIAKLCTTKKKKTTE